MDVDDVKLVQVESIDSPEWHSARDLIQNWIVSIIFTDQFARIVLRSVQQLDISGVYIPVPVEDLQEVGMAILECALELVDEMVFGHLHGSIPIALDYPPFLCMVMGCLVVAIKQVGAVDFLYHGRDDDTVKYLAQFIPECGIKKLIKWESDILFHTQCDGCRKFFSKHELLPSTELCPSFGKRVSNNRKKDKTGKKVRKGKKSKKM